MNEVTQEDRDAAADVMESQDFAFSQQIRHGMHDECGIVMVLSDHRYFSIKKERERIAAWLNDEAERLFSNDATYRAALYDAADAIASGEHEVKG